MFNVQIQADTYRELQCTSSTFVIWDKMLASASPCKWHEIKQIFPKQPKTMSDVDKNCHLLSNYDACSPQMLQLWMEEWQYKKII